MNTTTAYRLAAGISAAALALTAVPAFAATPFTNGSFAAGPAGSPFVTLASGDTTITGWTVGGNGVDYITTYWQSADLDGKSIDLSALDAGSVSQTFDTTPGATYTVTFSLAGNPDGGPSIKNVDVSATGAAVQTYQFDTTGHDKTTMGWTPETYTFKATANSTTLMFKSNDATPFGPALDNVSVAQTLGPVPTAKDQCMKGGWQNLNDDLGNSFKNQGDCVSYVATKGKNKAAGS